MYMKKERHLTLQGLNDKSSRGQCSDIMAHMLDIGYKESYRKDVPPANSSHNDFWTAIFFLKWLFNPSVIKTPQVQIKMSSNHVKKISLTYSTCSVSSVL